MELALKTAPHSAPRPQTHYKININNLSYKLPQTKYTYNHCLYSKHQHTPPQPFILKNVNCEAKPRELTVIAGPSGAGKTTLLEIIAGEIKRSRFTGQVLVNGSPMRGAHFRRVSGYITQDEALFPHLTVQETLTYSARLRLPAKSREEAETRVEHLLKELGLEHIAGARIGSESDRGISGGEKRRVSIGVELVHDPMVVLLDEPTSGLDSGSALHVIFLLKSMAKNQGKTIVLTIHQPGFRILDLIDRVVLLSDGTVLHNGSLSLLEERLMFEGHFVPPRVNVLEFAIDAAEKILHEQEEEEELLIHCRTEEEEENKNKHVNSTHYNNSQFKEVKILTQRFSRNIFRTKQLFAAKTIQALLAGIVLGTIFINSFGSRNNKRLEVQNQLGFLAFTLSFLMSTTTEALPIFLQERRILMRETSRGVYRVSSYIIANTLVFIPFLLIVALLYTTPVYWLVGLRRNVDGFLYFSLVVWMVVLMANSFVACFSALVPDFITGMSIIYGILGSFFLFSGYFMSKDAVPKYWNFMQYVSLFKYPFECFMINEYGGEGGKMRCLQVMEGTCLIYGDQFLMQQGLKESQKWSNLFVMLSFIVGYRVLGLVFLCYRSCRT
ncbi:hypothetical protein ACP275_13G038500 [Erythranthe tilingii]